MKLHVLEAEWRSNMVVLKAKETVGTQHAVTMAKDLLLSDVVQENFKITAEALAIHVS